MKKGINRRNRGGNQLGLLQNTHNKFKQKGEQAFLCRPLLPCWSVVHLSMAAPNCSGLFFCLCATHTVSVCTSVRTGHGGFSEQHICIQTACPNSQRGEGEMKEEGGRKKWGTMVKMCVCFFWKEALGRGLFVLLRCWESFQWKKSGGSHYLSDALPVFTHVIPKGLQHSLPLSQ